VTARVPNSGISACAGGRIEVAQGGHSAHHCDDEAVARMIEAQIFSTSA
jgi:hypothetical protein